MSEQRPCPDCGGALDLLQSATQFSNGHEVLVVDYRCEQCGAAWQKRHPGTDEMVHG